MLIADGDDQLHINFVVAVTTLATVLVALLRDELGARRARRQRRERETRRPFDQDDASSSDDE
jgi:hypothetical protein